MWPVKVADNNIKKQQKFYLPPKRYNKIHDRLGSLSNFYCFLTQLVAYDCYADVMACLHLQFLLRFPVRFSSFDKCERVD